MFHPAAGLRRLLRQLGQQRRGAVACGHGEGTDRFRQFVHHAQRTRKLHLKQPQHSHSVFQLAVVLIKGVIGNGPLRQQIELVGTPEHSGPKPGPAGGGKGLHLIDQRPCFLAGVAAQRVQPLPVFRQAHRDNGHTADPTAHLRQIPHGAVQCRPVVESGTGHNLAVHLDALLGKPPHDIDGLSRPTVSHHLRPQNRVCGVDRNVDRRDTQINDALNLPGRQIGQRHVVAHQKGQPVVVVLKVQCIPQPLWHLIYKAENTVVGTPVGVVHQIGLKLQPQVLSLAFFDAQPLAGTVGPLKLQVQPGIIGIKLVIQNIHNLFAVHCQESISLPNASIVCGTSGIYRFNFTAHRPTILFSRKSIICRKCTYYNILP